jgi:hypothetical protein
MPKQKLIDYSVVPGLIEQAKDDLREGVSIYEAIKPLKGYIGDRGQIMRIVQGVEKWKPLEFKVSHKPNHEVIVID